MTRLIVLLLSMLIAAPAFAQDNGWINEAECDPGLHWPEPVGLLDGAPINIVPDPTAGSSWDTATQNAVTYLQIFGGGLVLFVYDDDSNPDSPTVPVDVTDARSEPTINHSNGEDQCEIIGATIEVPDTYTGVAMVRSIVFAALVASGLTYDGTILLTDSCLYPGDWSETHFDQANCVVTVADILRLTTQYTLDL